MNNGAFHDGFPKLNMPAAPLKISRCGDSLKVYDSLRKKYVALTPEEYVRQNFVAWLIGDFHYPKSLMANEIGITLNGIKKRCDTVIFSPDGSPRMIVEYKSPDVNITQTVFDQIVRYNMVLRAKYLVVSNGISHYCCVIDYNADAYHFIPTIPDYLSLKIGFSDN